MLLKINHTKKCVNENHSTNELSFKLLLPRRYEIHEGFIEFKKKLLLVHVAFYSEISHLERYHHKAIDTNFRVLCV